MIERSKIKSLKVKIRKINSPLVPDGYVPKPKYPSGPVELCRVLHPEYDGGTGPPIFQLQGLYESKEHVAASTFLKKKR